MKRRLRLSFAFSIQSLLLVAAMLSSGCATTPDQVMDTETLFRNADESGQYFETAHGYALFPNIGKAGLGVGVGHGAGTVFRQGALIGEASMTQLSAGLQLGGQTFSQIIFFEDERALSEFCAGNYEFAANTSAIAITLSASAAAATTGANTSRSFSKDEAKSTASYHKGAAVFTISKAGLMAEISLSGQKFRTRC